MFTNIGRIGCCFPYIFKRNLIGKTMPPTKKSKKLDENVGKTAKGKVTKRGPGKTLRAKKQHNGETTETKTKTGDKTTAVISNFPCWLVKSEPETRIEKGVDMKFGIEDLKACKNQTECWDGVRNYQARNFLRDQMKLGQSCFFYHSNTKEPGIAGICEIVKEGYPDHTQFDSKDAHYDGNSKKDNPRWFMVDVKFVRMLNRYITLKELKALHIQHKAKGGPLKNLGLFTRARLSVQPIAQEEWDYILTLEDEEIKT